MYDGPAGAWTRGTLRRLRQDAREMTNSTIFMAYYDADPKAGGILQALQADRIEVIVLRARHTPPEQVPAWVPKPKEAYFYFMVSADRVKDAKSIALRFKDKYCALV